MDGKGDFGRRERQASPWLLPAGLPSEPENTFSPASQRSHASGSRTRVRGRVPLARRLPRARAYAHDWARDDARHAVRQSAAAPQGAPKSGQQDEVTGRSTAGSGRCKTLPMVATRSREELLAARLAILVGHWLEIRCGVCEARGLLPCPADGERARRRAPCGRCAVAASVPTLREPEPAPLLLPPPSSGRPECVRGRATRVLTGRSRCPRPTISTFTRCRNGRSRSRDTRWLGRLGFR